MVEISFIIPVYNTPIELLNRCLKSIEPIAEIMEIEILIVDDGSDDYIQENLKELTTPYISYYRKNNGGVSSARNYGIKKAKGAYLFFCDADDELIPSVLINKKKFLFKYELIIFDIELKEKNNRSHWRVLNSSPGEVSIEDTLMELVTTNNLNSPCSKLFSRDMLIKNGVLFDEKMITAEDLNFVIDFVMTKPTILYMDECCYKYHRDEVSRVARLKRYPDQYFDNVNYINDKLSSIISTYSMGDNINCILNTSRINGIYNYVSDLMQLKLFTIEREKIVSDLVDSINVKPDNFKHLFKYWLLKRKCWALIYFLSYIRKMYLEVR